MNPGSYLITDSTNRAIQGTPVFVDPDKAWVIRHNIVLRERIRDVYEYEQYGPVFIDGRWWFGEQDSQ